MPMGTDHVLAVPPRAREFQACAQFAGADRAVEVAGGSLGCNGGNPAQARSRIDRSQAFVQILGTTPGCNLSC